MAHTATLLPNGKVLIVGGGNGSKSTDLSVVGQAELFDPATASFGGAGTDARIYHSATLLNNGDVLLAGGGSPGSTADLEVATSGLFVPTGEMALGRNWHTATILNDGRVLVAGGFGPDDTPVAEAELYDPGSGKFAKVADMSRARVPTSTLLPNGMVLIVGGDSSAELFDPSTGIFTLTGNLTVPRDSHTATLLLDGRVLIVGTQMGAGTSAELYDPATGRFMATGSMQTPRWYHTATLLPDGTVLVAGGVINTDNLVTSTTEIYDPATGTFTPGPDMGQARCWHTATLLPGGKVLLVGGSSLWGVDAASLASAEIYSSN